MERFGWVATGKRAALLVAVASMLSIGSGSATVHAQAAAADPLKFATNAPVVVGFHVLADKTKDWEDYWSGLRALCAKSESADLKAFGETLNKMYKVDQAFTIEGKATVLYLVWLDSPSTVLSYQPVPVIFTDPAGFKAGQEGSKLARPEADALFAKFTASFQSIGVLWKLGKVGG
jgi:hypothetical protein